MKSILGEIRQLGFVSDYIDRSMRHFIELWNIGPWYVARNVMAPTLYKGTPSAIEISFALSSCGELQFEIVQQHNDASSVYRDALASTPGLHLQHVAVWAEDFAASKARALALGWMPVLESPPGPGEACYVVHPSEPCVCVEISDRSPDKERVRRVIREIARDWTGADPIREGFPQ